MLTQILRLPTVACGSKSIDPVARQIKDSHEDAFKEPRPCSPEPKVETFVGFLPQLSPEAFRVQILQMRLPLKQLGSRVHHQLLHRASRLRRPVLALRAPATVYALHPVNLFYPCRVGNISFGFHSGNFAGLDHVMSEHSLAAGRNAPDGPERSQADKEEDPILQVLSVTTAQ